MLKPLKVIAGNMRPIYAVTWMNTLHMILNGAPYGLLYVVLIELLKPRDEINFSRIAWLFGVMVVIFVLNILLAMKVHTKSYVTAYTLAAEARLRLGDHLRKLSMGFFKKRDPGDITALLLQDMAKVEQVFSHLFVDALACLIIPGLMALIFLFADMRMTAFMVAAVILAVPAMVVGQKSIARFGRKHIRTRNRVSSRLLEYLQGIKALKAFNLTGPRFQRLDAVLRKFKSDSIKLEVAAAGPVMAYLTILELGFVGLLLLGMHLYVHGSITVPILLIFLVMGYKFFEPLSNFGLFVSEMRYMSLAASRITDVMDTSPLAEPATGKVPDGHGIAFSNVSFGYDRIEVLSGIHAVFPEQSITALVGPSGGGKTTMTSLVSRFWDVNSGSVSIGGVDVREMKTEELHAMISMVFQDVYLFQDTIFNNIRVGKKDATREEVEAAAKVARCHEFIEQLDNGYDTMVGEGGSTMSGGEKQRISIARAILKDAPIVLLDEATASLDPENEMHLQQAIGDLVKSKTLVVIAHRLSTIVHADQILVLDKGRITEQGTHDVLLEMDGLYAMLWNEQQRSKGWKFGAKRRFGLAG